MGRVDQPVWFVKPRGDKWVVERRNASRASSTHRKKSAAVRKGKQLAKKNDGLLRVMKSNGQFDYERTYGSESLSSPG